jgi:superfamily II DNA or RNA helicase
MFDVVIIDECHRFSAMSFHQAISRFAGRIRLGLTATAFRNDGLDFVFQTSIGKTIHIEADKTHMPIVVVRHTAYDRNSSHKASYSTAITHLTKVKPRNQLIADDALFCLKNGRKILLLSDRLFQLRYFFDKICRHYPADKVCLLTGSDTLNISPYDADIVLATYGVAKEGIDIPALDTMMYASPISDRISITQSVGRLLRGKKEKEILIFDYLDSNSLGRALYNKRRDIYQELNLNDIRHKRGELDSAETV